MLALSHGWWKAWGGRNGLTDEFSDRGRGFNVLSVASDGLDRGPSAAAPDLGRPRAGRGGLSLAAGCALALLGAHVEANEAVAPEFEDGC